MKKIIISDYDVTQPDGSVLPYQVRDSLVELMLNRQLKLSGSELLRRNAVCSKILECEKDFFLMEEADYAKLKAAADAIEGLGKEDVELIRRIFEAETVDVVPESI